jgi:hypothetical protein
MLETKILQNQLAHSNQNKQHKADLTHNKKQENLTTQARIGPLKQITSVEPNRNQKITSNSRYLKIKQR